MRVLVVEDERDLNRILTKTLSKLRMKQTAISELLQRDMPICAENWMKH